MWFQMSWLFMIHFHMMSSHSWIDCIDHSYDVVYSKSKNWVFTGNSGAGTCEGYAREYPGRGDPDINKKFTYRLSYNSVINYPDQTLICQDNTKSIPDGKGWKKMIKTHPGDIIYFAYFANGHTVKDKLPFGKKTRYGVYWSGSPYKELKYVTDLTRSRLIDNKYHYFDDGNCGETYDSYGKSSGRAGDYKPCVGKFKIPTNTKNGVYQFVWYWRFYFEVYNIAGAHANGGDFGASYSSCFDVQVIGKDN